MRIVIVGAGKTGVFLAEKLEDNHEVTLIEQRADRVAQVRPRVPDVEVIEGDACEPDILETAGVEGADLLVAATGDDEDNLVVAMLARFYRVARVVARVNHPSNEWLFDAEWGVDVAVSSPDVLYGLIEKDVSFGELITLLKLQADGVAVQEMTLPPDADAVGRSLADLSLPPNVTVMAIIAAGGGVEAARGETVLAAGDQLLMLVTGDLTECDLQEACGVRVRDREGDTEHP